MGFGDVLPASPIEQQATVVLMYVGVLVFALLLSEIQGAVDEALFYSREVARVLARTRDFLIQHEIPAELSQRVLLWLEFDYPIQQRWQRQTDALHNVPMVLRRLLYSQMHRGILSKVPFLDKLQSFHKDELLVDLYSKLQPMTHPKLLPFSLPGRPPEHLYYIVTGSVHTEIQGHLVSTLSTGDFFGVDCILFDQEQHHLNANSFHLHGVPCDVFSDSHVHCLTLSAHDFFETLDAYPDELSEELAETRKKLESSMHKTARATSAMSAPEIVNHARWWSLMHKVFRLSGAEAERRRKRYLTPSSFLAGRHCNELDSSEFKSYVQKMKFAVTGGWSSQRYECVVYILMSTGGSIRARSFLLHFRSKLCFMWTYTSVTTPLNSMCSTLNPKTHVRADI